MSSSRFGIYNIIPYAGFLLGGFASAYFSHKFAVKTLILVGVLLFFVFSLVMLLFFQAGIVNIFTLFVVPAFVFFSVPTILANSSALALVISEDRAYASSLMNAIQIFIIFLTFLSLSFFPQKAFVLPMLYSISGAWMLFLWLFMKNLKGDFYR